MHIVKYSNVLKKILVSLFVYTYYIYFIIIIIIHNNSSVASKSKWLVHFQWWIIHNCSVLTLDKGKKQTNHKNLGEIFRHYRVDGRKDQ